MSDSKTGMWNRLEVSDKRYVKEFNKGKFKGHSVDPIYNIKRVTEELGPVGFAWGWEVKSERVDTYGEEKDQKTVHSCIVRAWFRQEDGSLRYVEHVGTTPVAYWTRSGYFEIDDEAAKKSVTDALSKIMVSLGASADIWLGRFDGNKYVAPDREGEEKPARAARTTPSAPAAAPPAGQPAPGQQRRPHPVQAPHEDVGEARYTIEGYDTTASGWIETARTVSQRRGGQALLEWWAGYRDTRAAIYKRHEAHRDALAELSAEIKERAGRAAGTNGTGQPSPDQLVRAG